MDLIIGWLQSGLSVVVPFVILLGLLIFVHEMGHFLVAKYYKVRVEVFSLGFGKKIFQFKRGETVYCLSLIPLGGYVKMYGDDPTAELSDEEKKGAFLYKPVGQRIAIVLAGPLMNFFFAILIFAVIAFSGVRHISPQLGDVLPTSKAFEVGFRSGDQILSINDQKMTTWKQVRSFVQSHAGKELVFKLDRSGENLKVSATPVLVENPNLLSSQSHVGQIEGMGADSRSSVAAVKSHSSLAGVAGLRTGDLITEINGKPVKYWRNLRQRINQASFPISLKFERLDFEKEKTESMSAVLSQKPSFDSGHQDVFSQLGFDQPELYLQKVLKGSPAQQAGLKAGDRLLSIDGRKLSKWSDVIDLISAFKGEDKGIDIQVLRQGVKFNFNIQPKVTRQMNRQGLEEDRYTVGIMPSILSSIPSTLMVREKNPVKALWKGVERTWEVTVMTALSFVRLFQAKISPKNIGGVLSIGQVASETFKIGWSQFLQMMAVISVNLFIINLLPVPVLDGGYLLFFSIEAIRGGPISLKKMIVAQQFGVIILMGLMAFALFNDFSRIFNFNW